MKLHALLVDDEPLARERLRTLLRGFAQIDRVSECGTGAEAIEALAGTEGARAPVDMVFLDVQMPEVDGFDVVRAVGPARMPPVIFVTAYDQHAVRAFEVGAVDYLLKPVDRHRFATAIERVLQRAASPTPGEAEQRLHTVLEALRRHQGAQGRFLVRSGDRALLIRFEQIDWIAAAGNYVELHVGSESHLLRETLTAIERRLDPAHFLRVHRHTIVNLAAITEAERSVRGWELCLRTGARLAIGRTLQDQVLSWLAGRS